MKALIRNHIGFIITIACLTWFWTGGIWNGILGHPAGDLADHLWGNEWFASSLHRGEIPFWVRENYAPEEKVLWHIDPMGGLFRSIFWPIPVEWAWNLNVMWSLFFSSTMMYGFAYQLHRHRGTALVLALMLGTSSYLSGLIHSGLAEYLNIGWGIALLWSLQKQKWWLGGLFLGLCGLQAFSYGLMGALLALPFAWKDKKHLWKVYALSLIIIAPALWCGWQTMIHPSAAFSAEQAPGWSYHSLPAVDLFGWFRTGDWLHPDTPAMGNPGILQVHYLGWVIILTCLWAIWRNTEARIWFRRIWLVIVLSLGPKISFNRWLPFSGKLFLPLAVLYLPFSPFQMVHHPYRMTAFLLPVLLIGVGYVFRGIPFYIQILLLGFYVGEQVQSPVPYPFLRAQIEENVVVDGVRLDWPPDFSEPNRQYLLAQLKHKQSIVYGVNSWLPDTIRQDVGVQRWIRLLDDPRRRSRNRDGPPVRKIFESNSQGQSKLSEMGIEWLVVHRKYLSLKEEQRLLPQLKREWGEPDSESETQWVFSLKEDPADN